MHRSKIGMLSGSVGPFKEFGPEANRSRPELFAGFPRYGACGTLLSIRVRCLAVQPDVAPTDQLNDVGSHGGLV